MTEAAPQTAPPAPPAPPDRPASQQPPSAPRPAAAPPAPNLFTATPQERYAAQQLELERQDPWLTKVVLTRGSDGVLLRDGRPIANGEADPAAATHEETSPLNEPVQPEEKFKFGDDLELTAAEIKALVEHHAAEQSRRLTLPESPDGYELKLPTDFKAPPGAEPKFDPQSVGVKLARDFAHSAGLSQEQFSRLLAIGGALQVQSATLFKSL